MGYSKQNKHVKFQGKLTVNFSVLGEPLPEEKIDLSLAPYLLSSLKLSSKGKQIWQKHV